MKTLLFLLILPLSATAAEKVKVCRHVPIQEAIHSDSFDKTQHERVRDKQLDKHLAKSKKLTPRSRYECKWVDKK